MTEPAAEMARVGKRWRTILVGFLVVLTSIAILTSAVGVWAHRTLLNTDSWVATVGPLAKDPAVTDAVATQVTNELDAGARPRAPARGRTCPPKLQAFAGHDRRGGRPVRAHRGQAAAADRAVPAVLGARPTACAHELAVKVLRNETKVVSTANGEVTFNLLPLFAKALAFVESKAPGIGGTSSTVPDITASTPPDQARAELERGGRPDPARRLRRRDRVQERPAEGGPGRRVALRQVGRRAADRHASC